MQINSQSIINDSESHTGTIEFCIKTNKQTNIKVHKNALTNKAYTLSYQSHNRAMCNIDQLIQLYPKNKCNPVV